MRKHFSPESCSLGKISPVSHLTTSLNIALIQIASYDWSVIKHHFFFFSTNMLHYKQKCEHLLPLNKLTPLFQQFCMDLIVLMFSQTLPAHLATPCCVGKWWWSHMEIILKDCLAGMNICTHFVKLGSHDDRMRRILFWIK